MRRPKLTDAPLHGTRRPAHPAPVTWNSCSTWPTDSRASVRGWVEPSAADAAPEDAFQFERLGYFVADRRDHRAGAPVFNRSVTLRDTWAAKA